MFFPTIFSLIIGVICLLAGVFWLKGQSERVLFILLFGLSFFAAGGFLTAAIEYKAEEKKPQAIDVYRGKTEIIITKQFQNDSVIKSDTSVVFKETVSN